MSKAPARDSAPKAAPESPSAKRAPPAPAFADDRPEAAAQAQLANLAQNGPSMTRRRTLMEAIAASPRVSQLKALSDVIRNGSHLAAQRARVPGTDRPARENAARPNPTGLTDRLKTGVEALSGVSLDHVRVHYNSAAPKQLNALAFAQGGEIHVGPGQERHLPHEAWHVAQQAQGRVRPTRQMKGGTAVNDDPRLEREADAMGAQALKPLADAGRGAHEMHRAQDGAGPARRAPPGFAPVAQRRRIPDLAALEAGIVAELNVGETAAKAGVGVHLNAGEAAPGSTRNLLSSVKANVSNLTRLYAPSSRNTDRGAEIINQSANLRRVIGNAWRESWFDRVDQRVRAGAQATMDDALYWAVDIRRIMNAEAVDIHAIELLGDELHDRGLGPAKVTFSVEHEQNPLVVFNRTYVIKPEDRSVEEAVLGSGDSVATRLNAQVGVGRQVNTLNIKTNPAHGTIMEYVTPSLKTVGEWALRKVGFWDSTEAVTTETIALAMLTGLHDLHAKNVMSKGGAPALIDADVAAMPRELTQGPQVGARRQEGFPIGATQAVHGQISGDHSQASQILQYAIQNPQAVTDMIMERIGNHRSRIVPAYTAALAGALNLYLVNMQEGEPILATKILLGVARTIGYGDPGRSPGLIGELGADQSGRWRLGQVGIRVRQDFDRGVIPHFQYEAATGQVFQHDVVIWRGYTIAQAMAVLRGRLANA